MKIYLMEYQIITSTDPVEFQRRVANQIHLGWQTMGGHQVITSNTTERGERVYYNNEYSISMVRKPFDMKDEVVTLLNTLRTDAEMALSGEWDCTTQEGIESFNDQIDLIDRTLDKLK